jgi:hypothetical protein
MPGDPWGYPRQVAEAMGSVVRQPTSRGFSQMETARRIGVDPSALAEGERDEREPARGFLLRCEAVLPGSGSVGHAPRAG